MLGLHGILRRLVHELRGPLGNMLTILDLWQTVTDEKERQTFMETLEQCCDSMTHVVGNLSDVSYVLREEEGGGVVLDTRRFDLHETLDNSEQMIQQQLTHQYPSHHLVRRPSNKLPRWVMGDPVRLQYLLIEVAHNAAMFMPTGGDIVWETKYTKLDKGRHALTLTIKDEGVGIAPNDIPRVTEPFYQVSNHTPGIGIGLTIVKHLVDRMDGTLKIQSTLGKGTSVTMSCTLLGAEEKVDSHTIKVCQRMLQRHFILIVSENKRYLQTVYGRLMRFPLEVTHVIMLGISRAIHYVRHRGDHIACVLLTSDSIPSMTVVLRQVIPDIPVIELSLPEEDMKDEDDDYARGLITMSVPYPWNNQVLLDAIATCAPRRSTTHKSRQKKRKRKRTPLRMLIIDNDRLDLTHIRRIVLSVSPEGTQVDTTQSGMEGIQWVGEKTYNLALVDMTMPLMNGLLVSQQLRRQSPNLQLVAMSAASAPEGVDRVTDAFLMKPITEEKIKSVLRTMAIGT